MLEINFSILKSFRNVYWDKPTDYFFSIASKYFNILLYLEHGELKKIILVKV